MAWNDIDEKDWKLFRKELPKWQERYMGRLVAEYADMLSGSKKASEKFWDLDERIKRDRRRVGVIAEMSRSKMEYNLMSLLAEGAIGFEDLEGFSEDLRNRLHYFM